MGVAVLACLVLAGLVIAAPRQAQALSAGITSGAGGQPAAAAAPVVATSADSGPLNPSSPLQLTVTGGTIAAVAMTDKADGKPVAGTLAPGGAGWASTGDLAYGTTYSVGVDTVAADGTRHHDDKTVSTVAPRTTAYPSFIPPPSQTSVGVGQPIVVRFDHAVHDKATAEKALSVTASPPQEGSWYWLSATEAHYRPKTYWQAGSTITLKADMFGVDLGDGTYGETDRTETIHVHDSWIAKADGATEQMQIFQNGKLVNTMPISLGSPGFPSHTGPHVISDKQPSIIMDSCTYGVCQGQPGYYKEQVDLDERISDDGEFVHSAPWSVGSQGGANVSHGCVNLSPANAQWFFDHFGIGDVVEITNSGGPTLPLGDTYGDWELSWSQWQAGSAAK
ncbi:L,D-transpeptidase [Pseudonocardia dioxanivorans]|uniref:L,D-transpeptidase n=1 Tax=Pseudonocardia dioxanivorans TaxID=240495 RepID=UPI001F2E1F30|nr:Ig-like domain-containing protein [Pseudonocardia dioxanivorans]